ENKVGIAMPLMLIFFIAVLFFSIAFAPKSYQMIDGQLYINRMMMPPLKINIQSIVQVEAIPKEKLKSSIRTFGSGAFLGYYGKFANKTYGGMTWYATDLSRAVLIRMDNNKKYIVTPDERESFVQSLHRGMKKAA
ncbi:MAG TPA: PH domain-containing protein, partial [Niabella sp.]|nr:PH domain-containing protein [Niabella sp.]